MSQSPQPGDLEAIAAALIRDSSSPHQLAQLIVVLEKLRAIAGVRLKELGKI
jgi:hypothetical protein